MTFTHRVAGDELETQAPRPHPGPPGRRLVPARRVPLDDGSGDVVVELGSGRGVSKVAGPIDWIEAVRPGAVLAFTRTDGVLSVEVVDESELGDGACRDRGPAGGRGGWIDPGRGQDEVPLVIEAMALDPSLFRRPCLLRVGEVLVAAGLERKGNEWGRRARSGRPAREYVQERDDKIRELLRPRPTAATGRSTASRACGVRHIQGEAVDERVRSPTTSATARSRRPSSTRTRRALEAVAEFARAAGCCPAVVTPHRRSRCSVATLRAGEPEEAIEALEAPPRPTPSSAAADALAVLELDRGNLSRAHVRSRVRGGDPDLIELHRGRASTSGRAASHGRPERSVPVRIGEEVQALLRRRRTRCRWPQRVPLVMGRMGHHAIGPEGDDTLLGLRSSAASTTTTWPWPSAGSSRTRSCSTSPSSRAGSARCTWRSVARCSPRTRSACSTAALRSRSGSGRSSTATPGERLTLRDTLSTGGPGDLRRTKRKRGTRAGEPSGPGDAGCRRDDALTGFRWSCPCVSGTGARPAGRLGRRRRSSPCGSGRCSSRHT